MFIATNVHLTKEITEYGTSDAKLHVTITDVQESGNSMFERKEQTMSKDIIYREDAIKAINLRARIPHDVASAHYASMAINAIRTVPSTDRPQEWIPCSERLPEVHEVVLVTFEYDGDMLVGITERSQGGFWISENVVAWQPLPQPWKGADNETD